MKKVLFIFFLVIGSQLANASQETGQHSKNLFVDEWVWLIILMVALIAIVLKTILNQNKNWWK
jgi:hypothetical protein